MSNTKIANDEPDDSMSRLTNRLSELNEKERNETNKLIRAIVIANISIVSIILVYLFFIPGNTKNTITVLKDQSKTDSIALLVKKQKELQDAEMIYKNEILVLKKNYDSAIKKTDNLKGKDKPTARLPKPIKPVLPIRTKEDSLAALLLEKNKKKEIFYSDPIVSFTTDGTSNEKTIFINKKDIENYKNICVHVNIASDLSGMYFLFPDKKTAKLQSFYCYGLDSFYSNYGDHRNRKENKKVPEADVSKYFHHIEFRGSNTPKIYAVQFPIPDNFSEVIIKMNIQDSDMYNFPVTLKRLIIKFI